jgi:hypothetical protein
MNQATRGTSLAGAFERTNGAVIPDAIEVTFAGLADACFFIANYPCKVVAIRQVHAVAGSDGAAVSLQITKDTGTNAPGAGTDLLTNNAAAGFDLKAVANTPQAGTLAALAARTLAVGDRLSADFAGTLTALAGCVVTVSIQRLAADA